MAGAKEIRTKIKSVQNTQKITRAMEMVAASKMRRAMERMQAARPYAERMRQVIAHLAHANSEYKHPFLTSREVKRVGFIVISTDRGLCGGLNVNVFRRLFVEMERWHEQNIAMDFCAIGNKVTGFLKRINANVVAQAGNLGDVPSVNDLIGLVKVLLDSYSAQGLDRVYLVYNDFINSMTQRPHIEQILPLHSDADETLTGYWDYIYEPDAKVVLDHILTRYIESLVYQAVVENGASEQAARMVAMKSASDNAGELIDELNLAYNKARQAAITQELSEIVGGAAAL